MNILAVVNFNLKLAMKTQRGSKSIALIFSLTSALERWSGQRHTSSA